MHVRGSSDPANVSRMQKDERTHHRYCRASHSDLEVIREDGCYHVMGVILELVVKKGRKCLPDITLLVDVAIPAYPHTYGKTHSVGMGMGTKSCGWPDRISLPTPT